MLSAIVIFIVSLATLIFSSDRFISASEKVGLGFGIAPFVIGVTVVAFGTSLPELMTSIISVYQGSSEIVVGNVVGSNITNILLVVGISGVISGDMIIKRNLIGEDIPMMLASALLLWFCLQDLTFSFVEAILFCFALLVFLWNCMKSDSMEQPDAEARATWKEFLIILIGAVGIFFGASYTVSSISEMSTLMGVDPEIVSLSALALGTSLPEVVVSVTACKRGMADMALGNVIGSNIFNTYAVMAIPSFYGNLLIPSSILEFSLPFMVGVSLLFMIMCISKRVSFFQGCLLLVFYAFFLTELFT
jgi:cation:H+ antiporter